MPLRDYVRSVRDALHHGDPPAPKVSDKKPSEAPGTKWTLRGDLPSDKLYLPDSSLETLTSTVFRPLDRLSGVVTALHGALGARGGFSKVKATLFVQSRLVRTSRTGSYTATILDIGGISFPQSRDYDIDTFEERIIELADATLYNHETDGTPEGKEITLPFQLPIPQEVNGFELAPSLTKYM